MGSQRVRHNLVTKQLYTHTHTHCMYIYILLLLSHFSCVWLCVTPIDSSPPGSTVPGILQARTLEWVAISFSNAWKVKNESEVVQSCPTLSDPMDCSPPLHPWDFPGKSTEVGCHVYIYTLLVLSLESPNPIMFLVNVWWQCKTHGRGHWRRKHVVVKIWLL